MTAPHAAHPHPRPPRLASWLLRRTLPRDSRAASIAGDLLEEFHADAATRSSFAASCRYWRHALSIAARFAFRRSPAIQADEYTAPDGMPNRRPEMLLDVLRDDLRLALRSLVKNPGFALAAVLTLAVGVGTNTAIFSVLHAVVLRDLPYREADRLAVLWALTLHTNRPDGASYMNARDWQAQSRSFEGMAVYRRPELTRATITGGADPERIHVALVGPGFFDVLGAPALLGRTLNDADFDSMRTVVISHALWRQRFAGDPSVIGRTIELDGEACTVIGVTTPEFEFPTSRIQVWRPLSASGSLWQRLQTENSRGADALGVVGRLRPGATFESARAELDTIAARLRAAYPAANENRGITMTPLTEHVIGTRTARALWLLFGAAGFVLLIACVNVANLVLARGAARHHELSLRTALGASRLRLIRQALTESLVLAALAGSVGLLCAWAGTRLLKTWAAGALPRLDTVRLDVPVFLFALLVALACGAIAGLLPALQLSTVNPAVTLRDAGPRSSGGRASRRLRHGLVIAELTLAVVLLSGAGLLVRSFVRLQGVDRGFDSQVLLLQVDVNDWARAEGYFREALDRIRALPGVAAAGAVTDFFVPFRNADARASVEGAPPPVPGAPAPPLLRDLALPGYIEAMRIPLIRGRLLQESDLVKGAPQIGVINEAMARAFWPGQDPVGKRLNWGINLGPNPRWITVVGVIGDTRRKKLDEPAVPAMYQPGYSDQMDIAVRAVGDAASLRQPVLAVLRELDPNVPPYGVVTVEQWLGESVAIRTLQTLLLGALAAAALILAIIGVYGIIHQAVVARTQEIGIRMALGASKSSVLRMVLASALGLAAAGLGLGVAGALAMGRTISAFLYETSATDPLIYTGVAAVLVVVVTAACLAPARRAARVDPISALRAE